VDSDEEQPAPAEKRKRLQKSKDILPAKAPKVEDTFASIPPSPERRGPTGPGVQAKAGARGGLDFLTSFLTKKAAEEGGVQLDMEEEEEDEGEEEEEEEEEWEDDQGQEA
jgi:hypothetical protein